MHDHDHASAHHHGDHDHGEGSALPDIALRVRALETVLIEKGLVDPAALDAIVETYEYRVGPRNGAQVVARAWVDNAFRERLLADGSAAIAELGFGGRGGEHLTVVANAPDTHNLVVCTLCSCYPWPVLGLPPVWYKSAPYRSRAVMDPRGVLRDFGVDLPAATAIRVWDSTSEMRYMVLPERPSGAVHLDEAQLAALVTRDSMIGTGFPADIRDAGMNGAQDLGGAMGFGPVQPEPDEPTFHAAWEKRVLANVIATQAIGWWNTDTSRFARESLPPPRYLTSSYYEIWFAALEKILAQNGLVRDDEIAAARALHDAPKPPRVFAAKAVADALAKGWPSSRPSSRPACFAVGDRVRVRNLHPAGHTRLPGYTRDRTGVVERVRGYFVYPDTNAHGAGEQPQWCYCVRFAATELWGDGADPTVTVSFDAFEPYLERA